MKNLIILSLAICLSSQLNSYINPEIKNAVRKSKPDELEILLSEYKLTEIDKSNLLDQAKEIVNLGREKINDTDLYLKKKKSRYIKLYLSGVAGVGSGFCVFAAIYSIIAENNTSDFPSVVLGSTILGLISAALLKYNFNLYNKIKKARTNKQKYLDAIEVEQILNRT